MTSLPLEGRRSGGRGRGRAVTRGNDSEHRRSAAPGEPRRECKSRTFGRAELAGVRPAVVLVHRVEQQPTLPPVEVHLAVEQSRLDQLPVGEPVHVGVLGPDDVALKEDSLPGVGCEVPHRADDGQAGLRRRRWEEGNGRIHRLAMSSLAKLGNHQSLVRFDGAVTFDLQLPFALLAPVFVNNLAGVNAGV